MNDVLLGARLMFAGGRPGWIRTALTALGVGIGVALLLLATAVPAALQARAARAEGRFTSPPQGESWSVGNTVLMKQADTKFRGRAVRGVLVRAEGPASPLPPGLAALPADGELAVSPALRALLDSPEGALLVPRFSGARVVATIGERGLSGPGELAFYRGSGALTADTADRVASFGNVGSEQYSPMLILLVVLGFVVLLLPIAVFLGAAVRFGGDSRDRRLAALRLVGADAGMARRIATGEAVLGALLGIAVGAVLFGLGRQLAPLVTVADISVFTADIRPHPALVLIIVAAVPMLAVGVTLLALRGVVIEPLGVTRRTVPVRRRLWWRLVLPLAGITLLYPSIDGLGRLRSEHMYYQVALGATLLLVGVVALLPWLVDQAVRRLRGGPVFWQLAVRRLQMDSATSARLVSGMAVAVAGTVGLQMFFATAQDRFTTSTGWQRPDNAAYVEVARATDGPLVIKRLEGAPGMIRSAGTLVMTAVARQPVGTTGQGPAGLDTQGLELRIGDCAALAYLATVDRCADRDVFIVLPAETRQSSAATRLGAGTRLSLDDGRLVWTIPRNARPATVRDPDHIHMATVLATPGAIDTGRLGPLRVSVVAVLDPKMPDAMEHLRNVAASIDPAASVFVPASVSEDRDFTNVRRGLYVGVVVTLVLMGLSLLVAVLEHLREQRRLLATLLAIGTPRRTLTWSLLCQLAVPLSVGMVLSVVVGIGLGLVLQRLIGAPPLVNWTVIGMSTGFAAAAVLLVNTLSLPSIWRLVRADGLRTE